MGAKYQRYLASREWALKRESVRARSGGICERCGKNPMQAVHHLTYEHIYDEPLEDLQAICDGCHAFESGKTDEDPCVPYGCVLLGMQCDGDPFQSIPIDAEYDRAPIFSAVRRANVSGIFGEILLPSALGQYNDVTAFISCPSVAVLKGNLFYLWAVDSREELLKSGFPESQIKPLGAINA